MNRTHLAAFHAVAEAGSFSRGAEQLMVTQPAVSLHVADLERALGAKLFDRLPRGVRLTDAGTMLLTFAKRIASAEVEAERAFAELRGLTRGRLSIGASLTIGEYLLPRLLGQFRRSHPGITIELQIINTAVVQQRLIDGEIDLGLTEGLAQHDDSLLSEIIAHDELVAIVSSKHSFAKQKSVTLAAFCKEPLILREKGSGTRAVIEAALQKQKIGLPEPVLTIGSTEAIKESVAAGAGVAIVSKLAMLNPDRRLAIVKLSNVELRRPLYLVQSRQRSATRASEAFLKLLRGSIH